MAQEAKTLMTAEEFARLPDNGMRRELVRGEVIEMTPAAAESGRISMRVALRLGNFVEERGAGACYTAEAGFIIARDPDVVRAPDVAFVRGDRLPDRPSAEGFFPGPPDLAVEVVSPSDQAAEVQEKVNDYLKSGTSLVWVVYPKLRQVQVHRSLAESFIVEEDGTLSGEPVLPDLSIPVKDIFAQ